jgi:hypothetical protein
VHQPVGRKPDDLSAVMTPDTFRQQVAALTVRIAGRPLDAAFDAWLNAECGPDSVVPRELSASCQAGVVDMTDIAGPHHLHPEGEVDLVMPVEGEARFDGCPAGWLVMPPGSAHRPTVSQGRALVLYLLPNGKIDFTKDSA